MLWLFDLLSKGKCNVTPHRGSDNNKPTIYHLFTLLRGHQVWPIRLQDGPRQPSGLPLFLRWLWLMTCTIQLIHINMSEWHLYCLTVSCLVNSEGFIGEEVLLKCMYSEVDPLPERVDVHWMDKQELFKSSCSPSGGIDWVFGNPLLCPPSLS